MTQQQQIQGERVCTMPVQMQSNHAICVQPLMKLRGRTPGSRRVKPGRSFFWKTEKVVLDVIHNSNAGKTCHEVFVIGIMQSFLDNDKLKQHLQSISLCVRRPERWSLGVAVANLTSVVIHQQVSSSRWRSVQFSTTESGGPRQSVCRRTQATHSSTHCELQQFSVLDMTQQKGSCGRPWRRPGQKSYAQPGDTNCSWDIPPSVLEKKAVRAGDNHGAAASAPCRRWRTASPGQSRPLIL